MDKKKKPKKRRKSKSTIGTIEESKPISRRSSKPNRCMSLVLLEDSAITKGPASIEGTRSAAATVPVKVDQPTVETVSEEASLHIGELPDDLSAISKPSEPQFTDAAFSTVHQESLFIEAKSLAATPLGTVKRETKPEMPETGEITGVEIWAARQAKGRGLPGIDLTVIYGNGFLQYTALFIAVIAQFALICHNLLPKIVASSVDHWCKQPPEFSDMTAAEWRNISAPRDAKGAWDQCLRYEPPLSVDSSSRSQVPCQEWDYDPSSGRSIIIEWNLVCDRRWLLTVAHLLYMGGAIGSMPIAGVLSDTAGRRPVICVSAIGLVIFGIAVCLADSFSDFLILRVFVAAFVSTVRTTSLVLLFELSTPKYQLLHCVLAVAFGLVAAPPFLGILGVLKPNWILAQALIMLPTSLLIFTSCIIAESPCWLVSRAEYRDAEWAILWAAKMNGASVRETRIQWRPVLEALRQVEPGVSDQGKSGLIGILGSPTLLRRSLILFFVWCVAITAYYARLQTHRTDTYWLLVASVALKVPSLYLMYRLLRTLGRRPTLCAVFFAFSFVFGFAVLLTALNVSPVLALFAMSLLGVIASLMVLSLPETKSCAIVDTIDDMNEAHRREKLAR
ncbi:unnamed protein product, partial [Ixodes hexagonus]